MRTVKDYLTEVKNDISTTKAKELETLLKSNKVKGHVKRSIDEVKIDFGGEIGSIELYWNDSNKKWQVIFEKRFNFDGSAEDMIKNIKSNTLDKKWKLK